MPEGEGGRGDAEVFFMVPGKSMSIDFLKLKIDLDINEDFGGNAVNSFETGTVILSGVYTTPITATA